VERTFGPVDDVLDVCVRVIQILLYPVLVGVEEAGFRGAALVDRLHVVLASEFLELC
jgi:hypothetical protein